MFDNLARFYLILLVILKLFFSYIARYAPSETTPKYLSNLSKIIPTYYLIITKN